MKWTTMIPVPAQSVRNPPRLYWLVLVAALQLTPKATAAQIVFRDDFNSAAPSAGWQFVNENPATRSFTARPGFLRILTERGALTPGKSVKNLYLREISGDFILETRIEFDPRAAQQFAGLLIYENNENAAALGLTHVSGEQGTFRGLALISSAGAAAGIRPPLHRYDDSSSSQPDRVWLRLLRSGDQIVAGFSEDGESYTDLGSTNNSFPETVLVGMGAANGDTEECGPDCDASITADFDFFQITALDDTSGESPATLSSVEIRGSRQVRSRMSFVYRAFVVFTDGSEEEVIDQCEWFAGPPDVAEIMEGNWVAFLYNATTRQATIAAHCILPAPGGGESVSTATLLVRVSPSGGGLGTSPMCGAGIGTAILGVCFILCGLAVVQRWE